MKRTTLAAYQWLRDDYSMVIGVDEVGLGAWAGPLVLAGVVTPREWSHSAVKDSKQYKGTKKVSAHDQRKKVLEEHIRPAAKYCHVEVIQPADIDKKGVSVALDEAVQLIVARCYGLFSKSVVVLDGTRMIHLSFLPEERLVVMPKADQRVPAVSAASVLAKISRDEMMKEIHEVYPQYGFDKNVGYGTSDHKAALKKHGVCPQHRKSYRPIRVLLT